MSYTYLQEQGAEEPDETEFGLWGSPTASAWKDLTFTKDQALKSKFGAQQNRYTTQYLKSTGDFPSPALGEWIMSFPIGWTDLKPLEMRSFRLWLREASKLLGND